MRDIPIFFKVLYFVYIMDTVILLIMKGLEPIVSAVMMLMIAIAAGAVVSGWVSTFSSEKAKNIRNYTFL